MMNEHDIDNGKLKSGSPSHFAPGHHRVVMGADGYRLRGRLHVPKGGNEPKPAVLFLRGWSPGLHWTYMDVYEKKCSEDLGAVCLSAQYRGMGSHGNPYAHTRADFLSDALMSYDFLRNIQGVDGGKIFAVGESLGGYMASLLSAERELKGMALRVPADFPDDGFSDERRMNVSIRRTMGWRASAHGYAESRALEAVHRFPGKILIVESERDVLIPHATVANYLAAAQGKVEHIVMEGAGHALINPALARKFYRYVLDWLRARLAEPITAEEQHIWPG